MSKILKYFLVFLLLIILVFFLVRLGKKYRRQNVQKYTKTLIEKLGSEETYHSYVIPYPVYYINMDKDIDRKIHIEKLLKKVSKDIRRIPGFNGKKVHSIKQGNLNGIKYYNKYDMSKAELGCTMSHLMAIHDAYKKGENIVMICEDDISLKTTHIVPSIEQIIKNAPNDWEILQLFSLSNSTHDEVQNFTYIRNTHENSQYSTVCYIINKKGMENIVEKTWVKDTYIIAPYTKGIPSKGIADYYIYQMVVTYNISPCIFIPDNSSLKSTIHNDHDYLQLKMTISALEKLINMMQNNYYKRFEGNLYNLDTPNVIGKIPENNIVWQYWEGKQSSYITDCIDLVKKQCKKDGVKHILLNPGNIRYFFSDNEIPRKWHDLLVIPHKADYIRALAVYKYGGLWLDADVVTMGSFLPMFEALENHDCFFFTELSDPKELTSIGIFSARKHSPFIGQWLKHMYNLLFIRDKFSWIELSHEFVFPLLEKWMKNPAWKFYTYNQRNSCFPLCWTEKDKMFKKGDAIKLLREFQPVIILYNEIFPKWFKSLSKSDYKKFIGSSSMIIADIFRVAHARQKGHDITTVKGLIDSLGNTPVNFSYKIPFPIYYINLDHSTERNIYMENQLHTMSNNVRRISAFNGKKVLNTKQGNLNGIKYYNEYDMSKAELGCTMSHLMAIHDAYRKGEKIVMICEDDVSLKTTHIVPSIEQIIKNAPNDWEILQLFGFANYKEDVSDEFRWEKNNKGKYTSCCCYIINQRGMEKIISKVYYDNTYHIKQVKKGIPKYGQADYYIYQLCNTYNLIPSIFFPYNADMSSTIHSDHDSDHITWSYGAMKNLLRTLTII